MSNDVIRPEQNSLNTIKTALRHSDQVLQRLYEHHRHITDDPSETALDVLDLRETMTQVLSELQAFSKRILGLVETLAQQRNEALSDRDALLQAAKESAGTAYARGWQDAMLAQVTDHAALSYIQAAILDAIDCQNWNLLQELCNTLSTVAAASEREQENAISEP